MADFTRRDFADSLRAMTTPGVAAAGYPKGTYWVLVPSILTAASAIIIEPTPTEGVMAPHVPTRIITSTPSLASSSMAMAAAGPPIPVLTATTFSDPILPPNALYSRCEPKSFAPWNLSAILGTLPGSPGRNATLPTSLFESRI